VDRRSRIFLIICLVAFCSSFVVQTAFQFLGSVPASSCSSHCALASHVLPSLSLRAALSYFACLAPIIWLPSSPIQRHSSIGLRWCLITSG